MNRVTTVGLLLLAAILEAGGDAIIRFGLQRSDALARISLFLLGACVLFAYGWTVNTPPWEFGRLLGLYVVFFFVIAQAISWLAFNHRPPTAVLVGGALIVSGGLVIALF
jgi:drug/metabolite transporter (DMT)-like permease